jgi:hypothetical protein
MAKKEGQINLVLEEKPGIGQTPCSHLRKIQNASTAVVTPKYTQITREALRAIAENIALFKQAEALNVTGDTSFSGIVRHSLTKAIRFKQFTLKKQDPSEKEGKSE